MATQDDLNRLVERLQRLEEAQGFSERAAAGLSAEVYSLARSLDDLDRRVGRLERTMLDHLTAETGEESPKEPEGGGSQH